MREYPSLIKPDCAIDLNFFVVVKILKINLFYVRSKEFFRGRFNELISFKESIDVGIIGSKSWITCTIKNILSTSIVVEL